MNRVPSTILLLLVCIVFTSCGNNKHNDDSDQETIQLAKANQQNLSSKEIIRMKKEAEFEERRKATQTGLLKTYYDGRNKKIKSEKEYVRGILHGQAKTFYEDGELKTEGQYVRGRKHGVFTTYYPDGTKKTQELYEMGAQVDKRLFDEEGKLISIIQ